MHRTAKRSIFELDNTDVVDAIEMVTGLGDVNVDAATFDRLTTGPEFNKLMDDIQEALEDAWFELAHDMVGEYVEKHLEVKA